MPKSSIEPVTNFIFVRHAQTVWNKEARFAGSSEVPLSPEADAQIAKVTRRLLRYKIDRIYASPLSRCQLTIEPLAEIIGVPIITTEILKERNLGDWESKSPSELPIRTDFHFPDSAYNGDYRIPNAETLEHLEDRIRGFLQEMREHHEGESIAVATHAGIMWAIQKYIVKNTPQEILWPGNCAVAHIETEDHHYLLTQFELSIT